MRSLPLLQLIGSPIVALIKAEAMAARASAEFIESVGFVKQLEDLEKNTYGRLRTVTFSYTKQDVNGGEVREEIELPLLSLLPIPLLQIKDAQLSFNLKVVETITEGFTQRASVSGFDSRLTEAPVSLMAVYKPVSNTADSTKSEADMKVSVNLAQSDIPAGLQRLFQIMDNAGVSRQEGTVTEIDPRLSETEKPEQTLESARPEIN